MFSTLLITYWRWIGSGFIQSVLVFFFPYLFSDTIIVAPLLTGTQKEYYFQFPNVTSCWWAQLRLMCHFCIISWPKIEEVESNNNSDKEHNSHKKVSFSVQKIWVIHNMSRQYYTVGLTSHKCFRAQICFLKENSTLAPLKISWS